MGEECEWDGLCLGFGDYLDAGLPVAKSAPNPYTTYVSSCCSPKRSSPPLLDDMTMSAAIDSNSFAIYIGTCLIHARCWVLGERPANGQRRRSAGARWAWARAAPPVSLTDWLASAYPGGAFF
jgi:hypothetical protein